MTPNSTIHASCVLIGATAVLIRGPSGAGKSLLAWELIEAAQKGALPFARLVADDRVFVEARSGRLLVRPAPELAGMIEMRGLGIRRLPYEAVAVAGLIVDLGAADAARFPGQAAGKTEISGVILPRLSAAAGHSALAMLLAWLGSPSATD